MNPPACPFSRTDFARQTHDHGRGRLAGHRWRHRHRRGSYGCRGAGVAGDRAPGLRATGDRSVLLLHSGVRPVERPGVQGRRRRGNHRDQPGPRCRWASPPQPGSSVTPRPARTPEGDALLVVEPPQVSDRDQHRHGLATWLDHRWDRRCPGRPLDHEQVAVLAQRPRSPLDPHAVVGDRHRSPARGGPVRRARPVRHHADLRARHTGRPGRRQRGVRDRLRGALVTDPGPLVTSHGHARTAPDTQQRRIPL